MGVFKKLAGIVGDTFKLGIGDLAHALVDHTDGVKITANDGTTAANAVVARPQGTNKDTHASTYLDVKERVIDLEFSFSGGTPPTPAAGLYGICHTSGGGFSAGSIYLSTGAIIATTDIIPMYKMMMATPRSTVTGTVSMEADALYIAESGSAPYTWTKKSPSAADVGDILTIKVSFGWANMGTNVDSTASIPDTASVVRSSVVVTTLFSGGSNPAATVLSHGGAGDDTLQSTTDNNLKKANQYDVDDIIPIVATHGGPVRVTLTGTATAGAGYALVQYTTPQA